MIELYFKPTAGEEIKNIKQFRSLIGSKIVFKVTNLLREEEQFVASRKEALEQMQVNTWKRLNVGQEVIAVVRDVRMKKVRLEMVVSQLTYQPKNLTINS